MNQTVYLLVHRHHISLEPGDVASDFLEDGEPLFWDDSEDDFMILGLYSSRRLAEQRAERARSLPGFRRSPEGFFVHEYTLDDTRWPNGFRSGEGIEAGEQAEGQDR
ncbi:hypothetical protein OHA79_01980 [Streptomyces sp. NBC_00841]|uniref:hypothetical protein n=1 Tax=Streptomyces sp. NBC_00841 TaxID=2975847 RepID=UPI002DD860F1|nr:hypothetical protein [Streptomyces sp. NBC_00841]WRZ96817.1 hypothetical protein OHA79_01980 [Streptomyces sp. NBC_00841]